MEKNNNIYTMSPEQLSLFLTKEFFSEIPESIENAEDMQKAGALLGILSNQISYMNEVEMFMKIQKRHLERVKTKEDPISVIQYEDAVDREFCVEKTLKSLNQRYLAVSKMITTRIAVSKELDMSEYRYGNNNNQHH